LPHTIDAMNVARFAGHGKIALDLQMLIILNALIRSIRINNKWQD